jgi:hypothetical protein
LPIGSFSGALPCPTAELNTQEAFVSSTWPTGSLTSAVPNALITGQWPPELRNASDTARQLPGLNPDSRLSFVTLLVDDNQSHTTGIVSIVRALPGEALRIIQPFADQLTGAPVALTAQRWLRGGRS